MFIVGVTGLSCSGKTTVCEKLKESLGNECLFISMDDYYKELSEEEQNILYKDEALINFDTPEAVDFAHLISDLTSLLNNQTIEIPKFDLGSCVLTKSVRVNPAEFKFIILEGVFIFNNETVKNLCNLKIWIETSEYICALRRFIKYTRDIQGYTPEFVYNQCIKFVIPGQETYTKPMKNICDLFFNGEKNDQAFIEMLVHLIKSKSCEKLKQIEQAK